MKARALSVIHRLHGDESGQDLVEYAFALALIALASITSMNTLAGNLNTTFVTIASTIKGAIG